MTAEADNTKTILRLGFAAMILMLIVVVAFSMNRVDTLTKQMSSIVQNNFRKIELVNQMHRSIELRWIALHQIIAEEDIFERDILLQDFYNASRQYRVAVEELLTLRQSHKERLIKKKLDDNIRTAQPIVRHFVESMVDDPLPFPSDHAIEQVQRYQKTVLDTLQDMVAQVHEDANEAVSKAKSELTQTYSVMLILLGSIIFLSLVIARHVTLAVNKKNRALANATRVKSRFLANMSHEIRTPLTAVIGFAEELLKPDLTNQERQAAANIILRNGEHLQNIVSEILDLSKDEANKLQAHKTSVNLLELINDVEALFRVQATDKGISFNVHYMPPLPKYIFTDPEKLKKILFNLCNNAIKFTEQGSVKINVSCNVPAQQLHFDIIDSGIGISAPQIRKVFEPFAQADASASRKFGGTGLGLFLSKRFAKLIGGTLSVDSDYGHGSCFTLSIPTGVIPEHELLLEFTQTDSRPAPLHQPAKPDSLSGNILLAEDTKDNQLLIQAYLKGNNLQITTVEDGQQAIDAVTNKDFDLVLMDIQMPIMTGLQATKNLRARGVQTPIVALTANVLPEDCQNYLENGFNDVIGKPINREQLVEKITAYLTSPGVKELELIYSTLLSEGDDFLPAIEHFVQQTNSEREFLQTHLKNNDWPELEKQLHRLKGSGGSVGFSIVTKLATEAEEQLKAGHHTTAMATINTLSNTLTRLRIADAT